MLSARTSDHVQLHVPDDSAASTHDNLYSLLTRFPVLLLLNRAKVGGLSLNTSQDILYIVSLVHTSSHDLFASNLPPSSFYTLLPRICQHRALDVSISDSRLIFCIHLCVFSRPRCHDGLLPNLLSTTNRLFSDDTCLTSLFMVCLSIILRSDCKIRLHPTRD